jgi:XTP/dITP diphosphohydrolase
LREHIKILLATHNLGKAKEIKKMLPDLPLQIFTLADLVTCPPVEETGSTFLENALLKAQAAALFSEYPVLADDSGLEVDALGGQPGVYSARFAGEASSDLVNNLKLLELLKDVPPEKRGARFKCALVLITPRGKIYSVEGICPGVILEELKGSGGFGYDPLFYIPQLKKTMAELGVEEKNKISHRGQAWRKMIPYITEVIS